MPSTEHLDQQAPSVEIDPDAIPNLDIGALFGDDQQARSALVEQIRAACHQPGFFYVHNTCVSDRCIQAALEAGAQFFDQPDDGPVKTGVHNSLAEEMKGWGPMFGEPAYQKGTVAHLESFDIGQQLSDEDYSLLGITPNIWPELSGFRAAVLDYYDGVTRLGRAVSEVISEMLGQDRHFINDRSGPSAPRTMRMLHYPANDAVTDPANVGIAAHTDFECFTIMNQTAAGLELTNNDGQWCQAPADIGTFTIIIGDMTERFSNGHFKATGHRVVNTPWTRYSLILFFAVDGDYPVAPLPEFISNDQPARYEAITQDAHIEAELARAAKN
jgi:isopenicillin N synthase-like dioxygenase